MEARAKGQVARSQDLTSAVLLLSGFAALRFLGPDLWQSLIAIVGVSLDSDGGWTDVAGLRPLSEAIGWEIVRRLGPLLLVIVGVVVLVLYAQVGPLLTWHPVTPSLAKINPLSGLQRLFSVRSLMSATLNLAKFLVVASVAFVSIHASAAAVLFSPTLDFHDVVRLGGTLVAELGIQLCAAILVLALLDYAWQRYRHERDLRMTKEEVKDELRSMEGDPAVKRRRRQLQLQLAIQRLRKDVPKADVVVTNPTHLAIAIRYDSDSMVAPKVVAKGADYAALRIRQIAAKHGIPIVERRPLARALFDAVDVGQYVPERFYQAIAEILAYVYELTGRSPLSARRELVGV